VIALADSGRPVLLTTLAIWRKDGLLPPLACQGLGQGKGKTYYWREENIVPHARAAFDLLQKYRRPNAVLWMLWLSGFQVPLPQLRRAWLHHARRRGPLTIKPAPKLPSEIVEFGDFRRGSSYFLLNAAFVLCDTLVPDRDDEASAVTDIILRALRRFSHANGDEPDDGTAERLLLLIRAMGAALETSNLISTASDADLREAQHYLCIAGRFLQACAGGDGPPGSITEDEPLWSNWLAERIGPSLFLLILVMLRSGRRDALERIALKMDHAGPAMQPARPIHHRVTA
jgi:hypothetical protein